MPEMPSRLPGECPPDVEHRWVVFESWVAAGRFCTRCDREEWANGCGASRLAVPGVKRTGMLPRRTPLAAVALSRGGAVIRRYGTLRPVSDRRRRQDRERAKAVTELRGRGDCCARCGRPGGVGVTDGHEKLARSQGGDPTRPDMLLCRAVCNTWAEDNPALAAWQGWKTSRKNPTAPCIADGRCPEGSHALGRHCDEESKA